MSSEKRILLISSEFPPGPGGIGNHGYNLIKTLKGKGFNVFVLTNLENVTSKEADSFASSQDLHVKYIKRTPLIQFSRIYHTILLLFTFKPDIIICSGMYSLWLGGMIHWLSSKKLIAVIHGSEVDRKVSWQRNLTNWALRGFKIVVSVSHFTQSLIHQRHPDQLHVVIPNAVDIQFLDKFKNASFVKLPGNPSILTVGNVTPRKGQHNIIKALPELIKHYPDIHYHCVGLTSFAAQNMTLSKSLGVDAHVTFHGKLSLEKLMSAYRGSDIFAMTSEHQPDGDFEGFGIAILEANYFGKPAIGSLGCGIEDAIVDDLNGYKVDPQLPDNIANSVNKIVKNYDLLSKGSKQWALDHDWKTIADAYIKLF